VISRLWRNRYFKIGVILLVLGTGPLLAIIAAAKLGLTSDPNPNPIGCGILAFLTFWPSVILIVIGLVMALRDRTVPPPGGAR
jgi:hypothetical protein